MTNFGCQKRAFNSANYKQYPFIEYSVLAEAIFCFTRYTCHMFPPKSGYAEATCVKSSFPDWKRLAARLQKHADGH